MQKTEIIGIHPNELSSLIADHLKRELREFTTRLETQPERERKPLLTRKETAEFFDVSLNCLNDWRKKGILHSVKIGQRTYFRRTDVENLFLNKTDQ